MVILSGFPCQAAIQRSRLKHSWLENEILNKAPQIVLSLRHDAGWPALQHFVADAEQASAFAMEVESGYSPSLLVDECTPLKILPEDKKDAVRMAIHAAYLECFNIRSLAHDLFESATHMKASLVAFLDEWNKQDQVLSDTRLAACWNGVLREAERLRAALDALPKGIVLP
jgi:hypothetical protein